MGINGLSLPPATHRSKLAAGDEGVCLTDRLEARGAAAGVRDVWPLGADGAGDFGAAGMIGSAVGDEGIHAAGAAFHEDAVLLFGLPPAAEGGAHADPDEVWFVGAGVRTRITQRQFSGGQGELGNVGRGPERAGGEQCFVTPVAHFATDLAGEIARIEPRDTADAGATVRQRLPEGFQSDPQRADDADAADDDGSCWRIPNHRRR